MRTENKKISIVLEALGDEYSTGCGFEGTGIDYQLYIDGKKMTPIQIEIEKALEQLSEKLAMAKKFKNAVTENQSA